MEWYNCNGECAIAEWRENLEKCIEILRKAADNLDTMMKHASRSDLASSVLTGVGSMASAGFVIASFLTAGLTLIPAIIVGSVTTGTGVAVGIGADIGKAIYEDKLLKQVQEACTRDYQLTVQLKTTINQEIEYIKDMQRQISIGKFGAKGLEVCAKFLKHAKLLKVAKIGTAVLSFVAVPFDIADIVFKSIKVHEGSPHEASKQFREIVDTMEQELSEINFDE